MERQFFPYSYEGIDGGPFRKKLERLPRTGMKVQEAYIEWVDYVTGTKFSECVVRDGFLKPNRARFHIEYKKLEGKRIGGYYVDDRRSVYRELINDGMFKAKAPFEVKHDQGSAWTISCYVVNKLSKKNAR